MILKKAGGKVFGAHLTAAEKKGAEHRDYEGIGRHDSKELQRD